VVTFKSIYGGLADENDPNKNPELVQFTRTDEGIPETFSLSDRPYIETSVGVTNIFKVLRIDFIKRLTYLDNPNISSLFGMRGAGIRFMVFVEF